LVTDKAGEVKKEWNRYPVVSLGAEFLAMGYLMRRNILAYKAPPNNEGYDLICIHPDARHDGKRLRVQVKSRLATDCGGGFLIKQKKLDMFDYLIVVYLNVGNFFSKGKRQSSGDGIREPEFCVYPREVVQKHLASSSWGKVRVPKQVMDEHKARGFEMIAADLGVPYPANKHSASARTSSRK
jgi:hypothetical protein